MEVNPVWNMFSPLCVAGVCVCVYSCKEKFSSFPDQTPQTFWREKWRKAGDCCLSPQSSILKNTGSEHLNIQAFVCVCVWFFPFNIKTFEFLLISTCIRNYIPHFITIPLSLAIWGHQQSINLYSPCAQLLQIIRHQQEIWRPRMKDKRLFYALWQLYEGQALQKHA